MDSHKGKVITIGHSNYILDEEIARGGNAYVFKAFSEDRNHIVAVKFLEPRKDKEKRSRFLKEIEFCQNMTHPNIIPIYECGEVDRHLCYAMPLYQQTLRQIIDIETNYIRLFGIILELCTAVKYIHSQSVIHRDIKPENIFIGEDGSLVLADFGIAHFDDSIQTKTKEWLGNKSYAAPEQLIAENDEDITTACDIYAIGKIINELFTKENPAGSHYTTVSMTDPSISSIDWLVDSCLSQNPTERPDIDSVLTEVQYIKERFCTMLQELTDGFLFEANEDTPSEYTKNIAVQASKDVLIAKGVFENSTATELEKINCCYHKHIHFKTSSEIKDIVFQEIMFDYCWSKFSYESQVYRRGEKYIPLNLEDPDESKTYEAFKEIVIRHSCHGIPGDLTNRLLKLFSSCCNYRCESILNYAKEVEQELSDFDDAPIMYIVYKLRHMLNNYRSKDFDLSEHIYVNWALTENDEISEPDLFRSEDYWREESVLEVFKRDWDIAYKKIDRKYYLVRFKDCLQFNKFKKYAAELSSPYHIFEGDTEYILSDSKKYGSIVELRPLNSFDITDTLAKLLKLRSDY